MTRDVPMPDPKVHLKGMTREKITRALFRRTEPLRPARVREAVAANDVSMDGISSDRIPHPAFSA